MTWNNRRSIPVPRPVTVRLSTETTAKLEDLAAFEGNCVSVIVRRLITLALRETEHGGLGRLEDRQIAGGR